MSLASPDSSNDPCRWLLVAVCLAALAMPVSFTGPAVALPVIQVALGGTPVQLNWVTNAFMLSFGAALMAAGALADAYGRRRLFLGGLLLVIASGLALACVQGIVAFDLLRAVQGLGCAAAFAGGTAGLAQVVHGSARTRAFSFIGTSFGAGLALGPLLSGWLSDAVGWRAVVMTPGLISVLALGIGMRWMAESRAPVRGRPDWPGMLAFTAALGLLTMGVLQAPGSGWGHPLVLGALAAAVLAGAAFVAIERRAARHGGAPMLDLSLFRYPRFVGVQLLAAAPAYGFVVLLVLLPIRFIGLEGRDAFDAGRFMLLLSAPILVMPSVAAVLARRFSAGLICAGGLLVCAAGLAWLSLCGPGSGLGRMAGPLMTIGTGIGLPWGLMDGLAISVVPPERAGMASGIFNTVRVAGEGIALALVGAVLTALVASQLAHLPGGAAAAAMAAQRMTTGDMAQVLALLPGAARGEVLQAYGRAFAVLLGVLAGVTAATALAILAFLRDQVPAAADPAAAECA